MNGDNSDEPVQSDLLVLEDGVCLGPGHSNHEDIVEKGQGRYSHWHDVLYFSSSDGSDPLTSGRVYQVIASTGTGAAPLGARAARPLLDLPDNSGPAEAYAALEAVAKALRPDLVLGEDRKLFWADATFFEDYARLCGSNRRSAERKYVVQQLVQALGHVDGELVECGAYQGATAWFMARASAASGRRRGLHLFDSFEGLSAPTPLDGTYWRKGSLRTSEEACRANLAQERDVNIYKGWIPDHFDKVSDLKFAFVHIDVDIYEPYRDSLDFFYPRTNVGGIILFDDYGFATCPGATIAVDEFLRDKPEKLIRLPTGQAFITRL